MNTANLSTAQREILWNAGHPFNVLLFYICFAISMTIFLWGFYRRYCLWSAGKPSPENLGSWAKRLVILLRDVLGQARVIRQRAVAVFHSLVFWGFLVLLFTTTMVFIDHDLGIKIYHGYFYLAVTLLSDLFGLGLLLGVGYAYYIRYEQRPDRLHSTTADLLMLAFLGLMTVQGFILEALRIAATADPWAMFSPVGYALSLLFWPLSQPAIKVIHFANWWFHSLTVFAFIAILPYTKFLHIVSSSLNLFFRRLSRPKGALSYPGDIMQLMEASVADENAAELRLGISDLSDLTWKQRLDLDACTSCGRCQEVCPAYNSGKALSPKWLILDTRNHMLQLHAAQVKQEKSDHSPGSAVAVADTMHQQLLDYFTLQPHAHDETGPKYQRAQNSLVQNSARAIGANPAHLLAGEVMAEDVFWSCTTCRACVEACPVGIEHVDYIVETRRSLALMLGKIPSEAQSSLRAIETKGNPFGPADERSNWAQGINVPVLQAGDSVDVLYWVGCVSAYDRRKQKIARSLASILNASGLKWGILGNAERCSADPARRLGEENIFQTSAKENIEKLRAISFNTLVANCPHCFNTLKNEYSQIGEIGEKHHYEVLHHTHLISRLLEQGRVKVSRQDLADFTYHDPCYLGRYNDTYDAPREILVQIGGQRLQEMPRSRERGLCCGAGGGHYWFDMKVGTRVNSQRMTEAAQTNASLVATACPFCLQMLEDGAKLNGQDQQLQVKDIAELVAENLVV